MTAALRRCLIMLFGQRPPSTESLLTGDCSHIVARYARGNPTLQRGCYETQEQADARRDRVLAYKFRPD